MTSRLNLKPLPVRVLLPLASRKLIIGLCDNSRLRHARLRAIHNQVQFGEEIIRQFGRQMSDVSKLPCRPGRRSPLGGISSDYR